MRRKRVNPLSNIQFVIVEPKGDRNIGSVVRIMENFGFSKLVLVNPVPFLTIDGYRMAASSKDMLDRVVLASDFMEAISSSRLVVATTGKTGKSKKPVYMPWEVAEMALGVAEKDKVSIVFGREDRGLENVELRCSHIISRIPTTGPNPSLNLSQAVGIYAWEMARRRVKDGPLGVVGPSPATFGELEGFYGHLKRVLDRIGYLDPQNPDRIMDVMRRLFGRCLPTSREIRILRGILNKVEWHLGAKDGSSRKA